MADTPAKVGCLLSGRHRAARIKTRTSDASIERSKCVECGHPIMRSLVSRRWILSTYLGADEPFAVNAARRG
ncbi:MAG: hypothetical protein P0Y59_05600 [Candidatus Sphingomonas phytovorans]|nr:hypothetical protein [Sphingomonas sp.]WEK01164.1 MAG: hypothetical protein P0Y59_05600 [Sphingomonas sp.]